MRKSEVRLFVLSALLFTLLPARPSAAIDPADASATVDPSLFKALRYRHIGPYRGGRVTAVAGVPSDAFTYYMGSTGGGVWKTTDAGLSWRNVSDGFFEAGSIGAVAVADSDPNVVYVGTGSACPRGNVSPGVGMYRSVDAGRTWSHIGLRQAGQIGKLAVHPREPDRVYAAALGHIFGPNEERGVFRSKDGGKTWEKVLFVNDQVGAVDIEMDANNSRVLYAAMWRVERKPWTLISGGTEGGIYKTTDGGDTWEKLSRGLPSGLIGKIGLAVSPADSNRVWAIIEAEREKGEAGLYRSEDAGANWDLVNDEPQIHQRPWYYHHLVADPADENTVYLVGDNFWKSIDAGKTFDRIPVPHEDNHDLWINPSHPQILIEANDGGANVTFNRGRTWTTQLNQPTAEIYRVTVDDQFPYRVYGGQQDNSTLSLPSRTVGEGITLQHWTAVGGGESAHVAVDPRDPDVIYAGSYAGEITRMDRSTGQVREIMDHPMYRVGQATRDLKYRFQWNAPIRLSPHDPDVLYHASQFVHRSTNQGQSWELISPDLTRNDDEKQGYAGEPITRDITGVEVYGTVFAFEESPLSAGLLWAGSDDGLVHVSRDGGETWDDVTPEAMPEWGTVNMIDLSAHDPGRAFIAVHSYRFDDFKPYIFRTNDYGRSWEALTDGSNGIPEDHFVRVVREDPDRKGLLYAGTEFGMYISFDDGDNWQDFQLNLPVTPVTDLAVNRKDLVVSTQGRGFWILDDLTPLHQMSEEVARAPAHLFAPRDAYRIEGERPRTGDGVMVSARFHGASIEKHRAGENPPVGAMIFYTFKEEPEEEVSLDILDGKGNLVRSFPEKDEEGNHGEGEKDEEQDKEKEVPAQAGMNLFVWDLLYPGAKIIKGGRFDGYTGGPRAVPGTYQVRLKMGDWSRTQSFQVLLDPRSQSTVADLEEQFDFLIEVRDKITQTHDAVRTIHSLRGQIDNVTRRVEAAFRRSASDEEEAFARSVQEAAKGLGDKLDRLEDELRQKRSKVYQDTENFTPLIDDQFAWVAGQTVAADTKPTAQAKERYRDLERELAGHQATLQKIIDVDVTAFNVLFEQRGLGPLIVLTHP